MAPNLIITAGYRNGAKHAAEQPDAIIANIMTRTLRRGTASVQVTRQVFLFIVAVAGRPGTVVHAAEIGDLIYGDDPDGGPENVDGTVRTLAWSATAALLALGYRLEVNCGRGWSVRLARTWSEAA